MDGNGDLAYVENLFHTLGFAPFRLSLICCAPQVGAKQVPRESHRSDGRRFRFQACARALR
jgi:hypothetical protein